jgi:hypothetical protein
MTDRVSVSAMRGGERGRTPAFGRVRIHYTTLIRRNVRLLSATPRKRDKQEQRRRPDARTAIGKMFPHRFPILSAR